MQLHLLNRVAITKADDKSLYEDWFVIHIHVHDNCKRKCALLHCL